MPPSKLIVNKYIYTYIYKKNDRLSLTDAAKRRPSDFSFAPGDAQAPCC